MQEATIIILLLMGYGFWKSRVWLKSYFKWWWTTLKVLLKKDDEPKEDENGRGDKPKRINKKD